MTDEEVRAILAKVQTGEMSPEDAAEALGATTPAQEPEPDTADAPTTAAGADFGGVRIVQLRATANRTKVIADPAVHTVKVSGPHRLRLEGDRLVVENEIGDEPFGRGSKVTVGADGERHIRISGIRGARISTFRGHELLEVRVNPTMPLDFDCDAGTIEILGVTAALTGRVNAGSAVIEDFDGPLRLSVNAGKLRASGRLDGGDSTIDVNVGKAEVMLEEGSNVRIIRSATLGTAEADHDTVGTGAGTLRVTCSLGSVRVHSPGSSLRIKHTAH